MNEEQMLKFRKAVSAPPNYLPEYFCWWDNITSAQVDSFLERLETATYEREFQSFFEAHPNLLIQHLGSGHGRWVIPQKRLGSELTTDFVIGERHSFGFDW